MGPVGLPDREDRRERPRVPSARPRLREPRRAAHGARPPVRLGGRPGVGGRDHRAHDRTGLSDERADRGGDGAVRRLRAERRRDGPRDAQAPRLRRTRSTATLVPEALLSAAKQSWDDAIAFGSQARLPQRAGHGPRADGDDRADDGLRHHRHRARARPREDEEARRRRVDAVREPDGAARARAARLRREPGRGHRRATSPSTTRSRALRTCKRRSTHPCSTRRWVRSRSTTWGTSG